MRKKKNQYTYNFGAIYRVLYDFLLVMIEIDRERFHSVFFSCIHSSRYLYETTIRFSVCWFDFQNFVHAFPTSFMSADLMDGFICPLLLVLLFSMSLFVFPMDDVLYPASTMYIYIYIYIRACANKSEDSGEEKEMKKCVDTRERRERERKKEKSSRFYS